MSKRVLAIEPYNQGSHRVFLEALIRHSKHSWSKLTLPGVHWKWRMRSAPLAIAAAANGFLSGETTPDVLFCSDMFDLPMWRGLMSGNRLAALPAIVYFHESQWTYPLAPQSRVDHHFGYTNLLTALAAELCLFNSRFHRDSFIAASKAFVHRMPDSRQVHKLQELLPKSRVVPPGFEPPEPMPPRSESEVLTIGWVHRWEHDKRPDRFLVWLDRLAEADVRFELILLGSRPRREPETLREIRRRYQSHLRHDGYAETYTDYWRHLRAIDVVIATADHEFFGIAVCEAVWSGAVPVLPERLSYPEFFPRTAIYRSNDEAIEMIKACRDHAERMRRGSEARAAISHLHVTQAAEKIDEAIDLLAE